MADQSDVPVDSRTSYRRVQLGIARGERLPLRLRHALRMWLGLYELEIAGHFRRLVRPRMVAYNVGAGSGYYALALARRTGARVYAFDADEAACVHLARTARENGRDIQVARALVGDTTDAAAGALRLDDFAARTGEMPAFVIADIEGAEASMLRGARQILEKARPAWIIETHGLAVEEECRRILREADYDVLRVNQRTWLRESRPDPENRWIVATPTHPATPPAGI
ncbi:MAG TPA: FkbM family methyltransferase [Candidatus Thermoplasmatota archaeon]|nr:FkbM family methyltransferase [Candidatus Thermoplasmatota archaeon]